MAGEYLLVAPVFKGQTERKVVLPQGDWYDFYTGAYVGNGETITVTPGLDRIPVYVKDGSYHSDDGADASCTETGSKSEPGNSSLWESKWLLSSV